MAHTPLKMSIDEAHNEVRIGGQLLQSGGNRKGGGFTAPQAAGYRINILIARLCFREFIFRKWAASPG